MLFSSRTEYPSSKNGMVVVEQQFDVTNIFVDGYLQSGLRYRYMLHALFKMLPQSLNPTSILILGLGGGDALSLLQKKYPKAYSTAVEWDEVMIDLTRALGKVHQHEQAHIVHEDACTFLATNEQTYDLIFMDLFKGETVSPEVVREETIGLLRSHLSEQGILVVNFFKQKHLVALYEKFFLLQGQYTYNENTLAIFSLLGSSHVHNHKDTDFVHIRQSASFVQGFFSDVCRTILDTSHSLGVRYTYGICAIEYHFGDKEPELEPYRGIRFVIWDRLHELARPPGWMKTYIGGKLAPHAIINLSREEYWSDWSHSTKNHRARWFTQNEYEIVAVDIDAFIPYFIQYARPASVSHYCVKAMKREYGVYGDNMRFFVLKRKEDGTICAGISVVDFPDISQSYYAFSFYARDKIPRQSGVWLLNYWFMECVKRHITYANLGTVYAPGQPRSWKGFSEFKMYFRPFIVVAQEPLWRCTISLTKKPKDV